MNWYGITFGSSYYVWLFPIIGALMILVGVHLSKTKRVAHLLAAHQMSLLKHFSYSKKVVKALLIVATLFLLWIMLMRPQWNEHEQTVVHEGRDILIALDVSRSMLALDCGISRLAAAKEKIRSLLTYLKSDRVGLILFSGKSVVHCPFTADYQAFDSFLDLVQVELFSTGTTAIDTAVSQALRIFERLPVKNVVISRLNEAVLNGLAMDLGGMYMHMSLDDTDVQRISSYIESFEKEMFEDKLVTQKEDQYAWFALAALILLLVEWLL